jgi:hypothetical protein
MNLQNGIRKCLRVGLLTILIIGIGALVYAYINQPTYSQYNPYLSFDNQQNSDTQLIPPACEQTNQRITKQCSQREIEHYYTERSNLAAQWKNTDIANLTFYTGILGIILLFWTLFETLKAGKLIVRQNEIALHAAKAEFQPYIEFSNKVEIRKTTISYNGITELKCKISIPLRNVGKTPIFDLILSGSAKLFGDTSAIETTDISQIEPYMIINGDVEIVCKLETIFTLKHEDNNRWADREFYLMLDFSFFDSFDKENRRTYCVEYFQETNSQERLLIKTTEREITDNNVN